MQRIFASSLRARAAPALQRRSYSVATAKGGTGAALIVDLKGVNQLLIVRDAPVHAAGNAGEEFLAARAAQKDHAGMHRSLHAR